MPDAGVAHLDLVELRGLRVLRELEQALLHGGVTRDGVVRHHQLLRRVALELEQRARRRHALAEPRDTLRVRGAGGRPVQHRRAEALAHLVRGLDEPQRLVGVRRLDHRQLRELGVVAVVLLVLRAVHRRVVGGHDHEAAGHVDHRRREERVGGDVETHVLHRGERAGAGQRGAGRGLDGHLLVGRPLGVDVVVLGQRLHDLGARRAGIGGGEADARLPGAASDRLVAGQDLELGSVGLGACRGSGDFGGGHASSFGREWDECLVRQAS